MRLLDLPEIDDGLRDYQKKGKLNIYQAWETCRTVLFQMPTGTGKTRLFSSIIRDTQRQAQFEHCRKGVLVLAHRTELIEQIDQTLSFKYGIAHGIVKSGYAEQMHYPVQVASVQTIVRRLDRWVGKGFSYIIIDEAHHAVSPTYLKICKQFPDAKVLGVTATPCRLSGDSLRKLFGSLVLSQPVSKFIQQGYLSPYQYYSIRPDSQIQQELDSISHFNIEGDYTDAEMMRICDTNKVRANIIQAYLDYAKGKKGIIYTINQEHNKHICEEFSKIGVRIKAIDSKTPAEVRKKTVADFRSGNIDIICNVNIFSEGFDCPDCEFIQLARPTCSLAMYLQQVGRGLRPHERKAQAVILDNVGSYNKFGLPSANRKWRFHFEGSGQRVTKSAQRSVLTVGRSKQEIMEGDSDGQILFPYHFSRLGLIQENDKLEIVFAINKGVCLLDNNLDIIKEFEDCPADNAEFISKFHIDRLFVKKPGRNGIEEKFAKAQPKPVVKEAPKQNAAKEEISSGRVFQGENGLYGYVLKDKILLEPIYESIIPYKQGRLIVSKEQKKGVYAIVGKKVKLIAPLIFSNLESTENKLRYKVNNDQALSEFILSHVKFQHGDYLVIRTEDGNEYIRYQGTRIITYKEIRYIGKGTYIVKNNNSKYGLIRCDGQKVRILRGIKYTNIELASDGDSIFLYGESGRPRYVSLHSIAIDH